MKFPTNPSRRPAQLAAMLCASLALIQAQDRLVRIDWLSRHTSPIRSIDPTITEDDFADLKPLMKAIGKSRIVVLGEQSHGDGATFLAKGRLIKFLHQKMGFDVLAWEAGLFNCKDMDSAVRDSAIPIQDAINHGIYPIWGTSAQVRPVFEYARSVARTGRPLEMIGFDHQFSGTGGAGIRWRDAMIAFVDKDGAAILPESLRSSLINDTSLVFRAESKPADLRAVKDKWNALPAVLDGARARLESAHGPRYAKLMRRTADDAVISLEGLARFRESGGQFRSADNNLRDQRMAENLIWLANDRYKGRRVIVWAATFHTLHEPSAIKLGSDSSFSYENVLTMGTVARKVFGRHMYTIGFTAAHGKAGNPMGGQTVELKTSDDESLEDLWVRVGRQFSFVDFRALPRSHWLHQPISARLLAHSPITTDWTRQADAVVFTQAMFPSTAGPMAPQGALLTVPPGSTPQRTRNR
jgi:erythromycin esterase